MKITVQKWGNSLAVRIPKTIAQETKIERDSIVDLQIVKGKLVLTPAVKTEYSLSELLRDINDDNLHSEVSTGEAIGTESW